MEKLALFNGLGCSPIPIHGYSPKCAQLLVFCIFITCSGSLDMCFFAASAAYSDDKSTVHMYNYAACTCASRIHVNV